MEFVIGAIFGAVAMAAAVAISITYDPDGQINDYRVMLGLEEEDNDES